MKWYIVSLATLCLSVYTVDGECNVPTFDSTEEFPDIFTADSHLFQMELSFSNKKSSMYITEFYSKSTKQARLDVIYEGHKTEILYYRSTDELFVVTKGKCKTFRLSTLDKTQLRLVVDLPWLDDWSEMNKQQLFFGPSAMLWTIREAWLKKDKIGKVNDQVRVRQIMTDHWEYCLNDFQKADVYLTGPMTDPVMGLNNQQVPVRIVITDSSTKVPVITQIEFIGVQMFLKEHRKIFQIPVQTGCERLDPDVKKMPLFKGSLSYEAEVIYRTNVNSKDLVFITIISVSIEEQSQHFAIQMTPWRYQSDKYQNHEDNILKVYDLKAKYLYVVDKTKETCNVSPFKEASPTLEFPDGSKVNLMDPDIFITNTPAQDFHYLGETETRGLHSTVYEKTIIDEDKIGETISTRYYLADEVVMKVDQKERNVPLRVTYFNMISKSSSEKVSGTIDVNYFSFETRLFKKKEHFDVSLCFPEDTDSKWFQFLFPLSETVPKSIYLEIPYLEQNFFECLSTKFEDSPLRFPVVKIDMDSKYLYVTGRILDRPRLINKYIGKERTTLELNGDIGRLGMLSQDECSKACFLETTCKRFSFCGLMCDLDIQDKNKTVTKDGCTLYEDGKPEDMIETMDHLLMKIEEAVQSEDKKLKLTFPLWNTPVVLTASKFTYGTGFGLGKLRDKFEDLLDDRLSVLQYGFKFDPSEADESGKELKERSLASCQRDCMDNPNCMTMSYCKVSGDCFLSTKTKDAIPKEHLTEDTKCIVYYRGFLQYFEEYKGIIMARSAERKLAGVSLEECAKECSKAYWLQNEDSCKSFDFCPQSKEDTCLLHRTHLLESTETNIKQSQICGHYSRKYLLEFKKIWHHELIEMRGLVVTNVTAEWCAKTCKSSAECKGFSHCLDYSTRSSTCQFLHEGSGTEASFNSKCSAFLKQ